MGNSYYKLNDLNHLGVIVRTNGLTEHKYIPGTGWVEAGLMTHYFCDESDTYNMFTELTEDEALAETEEAET